MPDTASPELAISLLDKLWQNGIKNLNILGREPFLYPHINTILQYACDRGFHVDITTNGTVISDNDIKFLASLGLRSIFFSIDGSSPEVNDAIRGDGVFHRALVAMQKLLAETKNKNSSIKVNVNTVLTKINASDIPAIIDLCSSNGVNGFKLSHLDLIGNASINSDRLFLKPTEEFKVAEEVVKIIPDYPELQFNILSSKPKFLEYLYKKYNAIFPVSISGCKACIEEIYLDPFGNISPCLSTYGGFSNVSHRNFENYNINVFECGEVPLCEHPFCKEFKHTFPLIKETYENYIPCNSCPYLTTLCYPCPLGFSSNVYLEELCYIAEKKLNELDIEENNEIK